MGEVFEEMSRMCGR